jgi:hypothetical protein
MHADDDHLFRFVATLSDGALYPAFTINASRAHCFKRVAAFRNNIRRNQIIISSFQVQCMSND